MKKTKTNRVNFNSLYKMIFENRRLLCKHVQISKMEYDAKGFQVWFCSDANEYSNLQKYAIQLLVL
jgi:hypothetical protein